MDINKYIKYKYKYLNLLNKYNSTNIKSSNSPSRRNRTSRTPSPSRRNRTSRTPSPSRRNRTSSPIRTPSPSRRNRTSSPIRTPSPHRRNRTSSPIRTPSPHRRNRTSRTPSPHRRNRTSSPHRTSSSRRRNRTSSSHRRNRTSSSRRRNRTQRLRRRNRTSSLRRRNRTSSLRRENISTPIQPSVEIHAIPLPPQVQQLYIPINSQKINTKYHDLTKNTDIIWNRIGMAKNNVKKVESLKEKVNKAVSINISDNFNLNIDNNKPKKTKILFYKGTTNQAIIHFYNENNKYKISILNFADSKEVCGEYLEGSLTQEEELCRTIPYLYHSLASLATKERHKYVDSDTYMYNDFQWNKNILYSHNLSLERYDNKQSNSMYDAINYNNNDPIKISVITAAAPNLNFINISKYPYVRDIVEEFKKNPESIYLQFSEIIKHIYLLPIRLNKEINILILGAIGCGDFTPSEEDQKSGKHNKKIAEMFLHHLINIPGILSIYDYICFAIPDSSNDNYQTFFDVFNKSNKLLAQVFTVSALHGIPAQPSLRTLAYQQKSRHIGQSTGTYTKPHARQINKTQVAPSTINYIPINSPDKDVNVPKSDELKKIRIAMVNNNRDIANLDKHKLNINKPIKKSYDSNIAIDIDKNLKLNKAKIVFFKGTTNQAIIYFYNKDNNNKICILNFANPTTVGGGYFYGEMAQEEELCRTIIDLYPSLKLLAKPPIIDNNTIKEYDNFQSNKDVFYSSELSLYYYDGKQSNNTYNRINYNQNKPIKISVITAAAPDLRTKDNTPEEKQQILNKFKDYKDGVYPHINNIITQIYLVPIQIENINILILGAFGCGAFSPSFDIQQQNGNKYNRTIAKYFTKILKGRPNILNRYDYICFAIPSSPRDDNYNEFYKVFKEYEEQSDITIDEIDEKDIM